jgi:hypothetical protein
VIDDVTPYEAWPPTYDGRPDAARRHWLAHPALLATEIRVAPDLAVLVARLRGQQRRPSRRGEAG